MIFDERGVGLSDRNVGAPTLEVRTDAKRPVEDLSGPQHQHRRTAETTANEPTVTRRR